MLVQATVFDNANQVRTVEARLEEGSGSYDLDLDAGRLASITFHVDTGTELPPELKIGFGSVELAGQPLSIEGWEPITWRSSQGTLKPDGDGGPTVYTMSPGAGNVIGGIWPPPPDLPAVISENWGSPVNAPFDVGVAGQTTTVHPFATANQFPSLVPNARSSSCPPPRSWNASSRSRRPGSRWTRCGPTRRTIPRRPSKTRASSQVSSRPPPRSKGSWRNCRSRSPWG